MRIFILVALASCLNACISFGYLWPKPQTASTQKTTSSITPQQKSGPNQHQRVILPVSHWAVSYGKIPASLQKPCDLLITEPRIHAKLKTIPCTYILGYVSLGEINRGDRDYPHIVGQLGHLGPSLAWPTSVRMDIRSVRLQNWLLNTLVAGAIKAGANGIFLDTFDAICASEDARPEALAGMTKAAIAWVQKLRQTYPNLVIALNGGQCAVERLAPYIDAWVIESTFGGFDWQAQTFRSELTETQRNKRLESLKQAQDVLGLKVLLLEYFSRSDVSSKQAVCQKAEALGFSPYFGPLDLQEIWPQGCPATISPAASKATPLK